MPISRCGNVKPSDNCLCKDEGISRFSYQHDRKERNNPETLETPGA